MDVGKSVTIALGLSLLLVTPLLTYHGTKRTGTLGNALTWGLLGSLAWPIALPVAFVQGFGEPLAGRSLAGLRGQRRLRGKRASGLSCSCKG